MLEKTLLIILISLIVLITAVLLTWVTERLYPVAAEGNSGEPQVIINNRKWTVEIADDTWERAKGLSGRESLAGDRGMLFVFNKPDVYKFWMRGMKFPLDFVWIRGDKVVDVTANAPPANLGNLEFYYPSEPADMVLEINAGSVAKYGVEKGDKVKILR
ncbi:MAG: DUF192 domain-containing protein [Patescibacteria group bacterium]